MMVHCHSGGRRPIESMTPIATLQGDILELHVKFPGAGEHAEHVK